MTKNIPYTKVHQNDKRKNLIKRNFSLVSRCYMCQSASESINHLFLHCPVAADLWHMFLAIFNLKWSMPHTVRDAYTSWSSRRFEKSIRNIWIMVPACIFWCIWTERNRRCFVGISTPVCSLKASCLVNLYSWANLLPVNNSDVLFDFVSSLVL